MFPNTVQHFSTVKSKIDRVQNRYDKLLVSVKSQDSSADFKELRKGFIEEFFDH